MSRDPIPTHFFVLVAVRKEGKYLLVHERKHGQHWYLPAGRVEPCEDFLSAAKRETLEEAGIEIEVDGVIRFEHTPRGGMTRVRAILTAKPIDNTPPKSQPDEESLEANWFTLEEMKSLSLRGSEVERIFYYLERGGQIFPLSALSYEGGHFEI